MIINSMFTESELAVLSDHRSRKLVCPPHLTDVACLQNNRHLEWMADNTHSHQYKEVLFVLAGSVMFGCMGKVYPTEPGTVFVFDSYTEHDLYYPDYAEGFEHLWMFTFKDRCIYQRVGAQICEGRIVDRVQTLAHVEESRGGALLNAASVSTGPADLLRLQAALVNLVYDIVKEGYREQEPATSFQDQVIDAIVRHVQDTSGRGASLDALARISGYSKYHFLRLFKQHTGFGVHEYVNNCRKHRARELEAEGKYKKEIAAELGFSCLAAYSRWRKQKLET